MQGVNDGRPPVSRIPAVSSTCSGAAAPAVQRDVGLTLRSAVGAITLALLTGCINLGPDYEQPEAEVEPDWLLTENGSVSSDSPISEQWWQQAFQDQDMDRLIDLSLSQNLTLRSAGLREPDNRSPGRYVASPFLPALPFDSREHCLGQRP